MNSKIAVAIRLAVILVAAILMPPPTLEDNRVG
jgi:hypothetical protein